MTNSSNGNNNMSKRIKGYKTRNSSAFSLTHWFILALGLTCVLLPLQTAQSNILPDADGKDDSEVIVSRIKESLTSAGLISLEQKSGRLLFNPVVDKLHHMALKQKFFMPGIVVNQKQGLKLVGELPLSCFMLSGGELASENYKGYRQHETLRYIRDVKAFPVSRALICQTIGSATKHWKKHLALDEETEPFVFQEHVSVTGEHFYYFLNVDGSFEMYM